MKSTLILLGGGFLAMFIAIKILKFIVLPYLIPLALIGVAYYGFKNGWFKKLF